MSKQWQQQGAQLFLPLLVLTFCLWFLYRVLFHFPVLFDELVGKALFFALPVLFYLSVSNEKQILQSFARQKIKSGLLLGLAAGGTFGFVFALIAALRQTGVSSNGTLPAYQTAWFWQEFGLALLTSIWETLFFFAFVYGVVMKHYKNWSLFKQVLVVASVFLAFHLPNIFLQFSWSAAFLQIILLFFFALGQALFFSQRRNAYAAILIQAIWGMVLLVYF